MTKLETLKQQVAEMHETVNRMEQETFTYPMWFKSTNNVIIKFTSLHTGTVVKNEQNSNNGDYVISITPHTDFAVWTQVDEPKVKKWEPKGGEWGVFPTVNSVSHNRYYGQHHAINGCLYQTKEQAEWASKQMRSFNRLLCYVAEHTTGIPDDIEIVFSTSVVDTCLSFKGTENLWAKIQSGEVVL